MNVFWRPEPLNEHEAKLLSLCFEAHAQSALRQNVSSVVFNQVAISSGDYTKAVSAALMSLGGMHAPLLPTWQLLAAKDLNIKPLLDIGIKIPGWGNSFEKGHDDPLWATVENYIAEHFNAIWQRIVYVTAQLETHGKKLFPNPSAFTAATGIALRMPPEILPWLFLNGRLNVWTAMFCNSLRKEGGLSAL